MLIKTKSKARLKVQNYFIKCIELSIELFGNLIFPKHSFLKVFYITLDKIIAADNFVIGLSSILLFCLPVPSFSPVLAVSPPVPWPGVRMWCDWTPHTGARTLSLWLQTVLGPCWTLGSSPRHRV